MYKRIAIDIDDTVADYMGGAIPMMEKLYGLKPAPSEPGIFSKEARWQTLGYPVRTREEVKQLRKDMYIKGRLFRDLPLLEPGVNDLCHHLKSWDFKIYFITARDPEPEIIEDTHHWLDTNGFIYDDVFFTDHKTDLCKLMRIPILVEDDAKNIRSALLGGLKVILRNADWNKHLDEEYAPETLNRVFSWLEIPEVAGDLLK